MSRRREYTWRAIRLRNIWIGTDTHLANQLVQKALRERSLPGLEDFSILANEPSGVRGGRLDFLLGNSREKVFLEVKSATVAGGGIAQFPDSVSPRAVAHLDELRRLAQKGHRAVLLFLVQRGDVEAVRVKRGSDHVFGKAFDKARRAGVMVRAVKHAVSEKGFGPPVLIPVVE